MSRLAFLVLLMAPFATAQAQSANPPQSSPQVSVRPTTTLTGCLYREEQVPGRKPDVLERAGIGEDYIIAGVRVAGEQRPTGTAGSASTAVPSTGTTYKVGKIADEKLKPLVGKRVEVTGRIDPEGRSRLGVGGPKPDAGLGPDKISLPEIEASSIREVSGQAPCPAKAPVQ